MRDHAKSNVHTYIHIPAHTYTLSQIDQSCNPCKITIAGPTPATLACVAAVEDVIEDRPQGGMGGPMGMGGMGMAGVCMCVCVCICVRPCMCLTLLSVV
jgi:hypothetical protein